MSYISGDRRREGIFPLWPIAGNLTISQLRNLSRFGVIKSGKELSFIKGWLERLAVKTAGPSDPITALSGGNQQKVIIARALGTNSDLVVLDDPTRGVDAAAKQDLLQLLEEATGQGRGALFYSSEEQELKACDRIYVLSAGRVVGEVTAAEYEPEGLVTAAFKGQSDVTRVTADSEASLSKVARRVNDLIGQRWLLPLVALLVMLTTLGTLNSKVFTYGGLELLLGAAVPLVFASMAQMFIVALGDIDLGLGAFLGLVNVIVVTWVTGSPLLGIAALLLLLIVYLLLGALVHLRQLPSIVATLGASFVWLGAALTIRPTVGGTAPSWLLDIYRFDTPIVPMPLLIAICVALIGWWVMMRTRFGVLVRAFGNNPSALTAAGWSTLAIRVGAFAMAGLLSVFAGIALTAVTTSGDASSAQSYTLLSITAVIMGGSAFAGGIVVPQGIAAAAITLSFVGLLLSILNIDPNLTSAAVGIILVLVLAGRGLGQKARTK